MESSRSFLWWWSKRSLPSSFVHVEDIAHRGTNPALSCVGVVPAQVNGSSSWVAETRIWPILYGLIDPWNYCAQTACPRGGCFCLEVLSADSQTTSPSCSLTLLLPLVAGFGAHRIISLLFSNSSRFLAKPSLTVQIKHCMCLENTKPVLRRRNGKTEILLFVVYGWGCWS